MDTLTDPADKKRLAVSVFREVWVEFYAWEQQYSQDLIQSLAAKEPLSSTAWDDHSEHPAHPSDSDTEEFSIWEYDADDICGIEPIKHASYNCTEVAVMRFKPHPRYQSCTPISSSMRRDVLYDYLAPFAAYADDPGFDLDEHLHGFEDSFSWQTDFKDPDRKPPPAILLPSGPAIVEFDPPVEMINTEAVRRLHYMHNFSLQDIDELRIFRPTRISSQSGLLWEVSQRSGLSPELLTWLATTTTNHRTGTPSYGPAPSPTYPPCPHLSCPPFRIFTLT